MRVDSIKNGIVIDHILPGCAMKIYRMLRLNELDCTVAVLQNVPSKQMGKKDIIKIDKIVDIDYDILGYASPDITLDIVREGTVCEKIKIETPKELHNVLFCNNPRCISSTEQEIEHIFKLSDKEKRIYRCIYCDKEQGI